MSKGLQKILRTERADDNTALSALRWLDGCSFSFEAKKAFKYELNGDTIRLSPLCDYYIVYSDDKKLLLLKAVPGLFYINITFARLFEKVHTGTEAHIWLRNAFKEQLIPHCRKHNIRLIKDSGITCKGERVFHHLKTLCDAPMAKEELSIKEIKIYHKSPHPCVYIKLAF